MENAHSAESQHAPAPTEGDAPASRSFPCPSCGADFVFHIGVQSLKCPYCSFVHQIETSPDAAIDEQDYHAIIRKLVEVRDANRHDEQGFSEVQCDACGGNVRFLGTLTSQQCPYCGSPLQLADVHEAAHRVPVDGVLPFLIAREQAATNLREWVKTRWFAPNEFKARGVDGKFNGVYAPYWTFDSMTFTRYIGQRGEHYWVTVGSGKNQRRVRRTRWYPASGAFQRFFDDVLIVASTALPKKRADDLEPWPLQKCRPFDAKLLAGFLARTYDVELESGFEEARTRIDQALELDVRQRIGGDEQRIHDINTRYNAVTYKHLLLPVWMLAYRFREKTYQVVINAGTGEVQGDRPYSWIKITLAVLAGLAIVGAAVYIFSQQ